MNIFKHVCAEDGVSVSYFIQNEDECNDHHEALPSCCAEAEEEVNDDCCSDVVSYLSVKLDYFESFDSFDFAPMQLAEIGAFNINFQSIGLEEVYVAHTYDDPPPKDSQSIRVSQQVFRI